MDELYLVLDFLTVGPQKPPGSDYDLVTATCTTRSVAIIEAQQAFPMGHVLYMDEQVSSTRIVRVAVAFLLPAVVGAGTYVACKPNDPSTQNWLAWIALIYALLLAFLFLIGMRKL